MITTDNKAVYSKEVAYFRPVFNVIGRFQDGLEDWTVSIS